MAAHRWSVEVLGGAQMSTLLANSFPDLPIELEDDGRLFISHDDWTEATDAAGVRDAAKELLEKILPPLAITNVFVPATGIGSEVREHDDAGEVARRHQYLEVRETLMITCTFGSATITVNGVSPEPVRTQGERAHALQQTSSDFANAARLFQSAGGDVRQLYVAYEFIRDAICGRPDNWRELVARGWATEDELGRFRDTANKQHRHKPKHMDDPMQPDEVRSLIRRLLARWVDEVVPS